MVRTSWGRWKNGAILSPTRTTGGPKAPLGSGGAGGPPAWFARSDPSGARARDRSGTDAGAHRSRAPGRGRGPAPGADEIDPHVRDAVADLRGVARRRAHRQVSPSRTTEPAPPPEAWGSPCPRVRRRNRPSPRRPAPFDRYALRARAGGRYTSRRCPRAGGGVRHGPGPHRLAA